MESALIKTLSKRTLKSSDTKLAVLIATILSCSQILIAYTPLPEIDQYPYPISLFAMWLGADMFTFPSQLCFISLPFIAFLPFGAQYLQDIKTGYIKNIAILTNRNKIFSLYFLTTFITATAVTIYMFVLNFLVSAMIYPAIQPLPEASFPIKSGDFLATVFYELPILYYIIYIIIIAIYMGALSCMGIALTQHFKNVFFAKVITTIIHYFFSFLMLQLHHAQFAPYYFLQPGQPIKFDLTIYLFYLCIILSFAILVFHHGVSKDDFL